VDTPAAAATSTLVSVCRPFASNVGDQVVCKRSQANSSANKNQKFALTTDGDRDTLQALTLDFSHAFAMALNVLPENIWPREFSKSPPDFVNFT
jgi:hypothetical protein